MLNFRKCMFSNKLAFNCQRQINNFVSPEELGSSLLWLFGNPAVSSLSCTRVAIEIPLPGCGEALGSAKWKKTSLGIYYSQRSFQD